MPNSRISSALLMACSLFVGTAGTAATALASDRIAVSFNDPAALYTAYYDDLQRVTLAAGDSWLAHFLAPDTDRDLSVTINFASMATASGHSATSSFIGTSDSGLRLFAQGAAHEVATGIDPNGAAADIVFNLGIDGYLQHELWFDPAPALRLAAVPDHQTDAVSVLLHEFGHAFGFNGWRDSSTGALPGDYASTFDALVGSQPAPDGTALFFTGAAATAAYGGALPLTFGNYGHLGNEGAAATAAGLGLLPDLMNGVAFYRGTRYDISALDLAVMRDIGLPSVTAVPEPATALLWLAGLCGLVAARRSMRAVAAPGSAAAALA